MFPAEDGRGKSGDVGKWLIVWGVARGNEKVNGFDERWRDLKIETIGMVPTFVDKVV